MVKRTCPRALEHLENMQVVKLHNANAFLSKQMCHV